MELLVYAVLLIAGINALTSRCSIAISVFVYLAAYELAEYAIMEIGGYVFMNNAFCGTLIDYAFFVYLSLSGKGSQWTKGALIISVGYGWLSLMGELLNINMFYNNHAWVMFITSLFVFWEGLNGGFKHRRDTRAHVDTSFTDSYPYDDYSYKG